jgi:hypothetical protein
MYKITRLITESLKGKNKFGHRISFGEVGRKISVFETEEGKMITEDEITFEEKEFFDKTVAILKDKKDSFSIDDVEINIDDNSLDLKSFLPKKLANLLTFIGIKDGQIPKETYPQIMNVQDIVNFYGKPVDKQENKYLYDRLIDLFGKGIDGNSNGVIGNNLTPAWTHPEINEEEEQNNP